MCNINHGYGPITINEDDCIVEIEEDLNQNGENEEQDYIKTNLSKIKKSLESLPIIGDINNATAIIVFGPYVIQAEEMTQEEYDSLPEFDGY